MPYRHARGDLADEAALKGLLLKGLAGDEAAHRAFLTEAAALLRAFFRSRLRGRNEDAEDLVQETLVALHTRRESYDPSYPLTAWLYAIARRGSRWERSRRRSPPGTTSKKYGAPPTGPPT